MPLFEYTCSKCGNEQENLVQSNIEESPVCEKCGAGELEQKISSFAVSSGSSEPEICGCGSESGCCQDC